MGAEDKIKKIGWDFLESEKFSVKFKSAVIDTYNQLQKSDVPEEITHAQSTRKWMLVLRPQADEILQLAALSHDIERSRQDRFIKEDFLNYEDYKREHAKIGAEIAGEIAESVGYNENEVSRLRQLIVNHEVGGDDPDIQLLTDADSLSFF